MYIHIKIYIDYVTRCSAWPEAPNFSEAPVKSFKRLFCFTHLLLSDCIGNCQQGSRTLGNGYQLSLF